MPSPPIAIQARARQAEANRADRAPKPFPAEQVRYLYRFGFLHRLRSIKRHRFISGIGAPIAPLPVRLALFAAVPLMVAACGAKTPPCNDETVIAAVMGHAEQAIVDGLLRNDPELRVEQIMSQVRLTVTDVASTGYNKSIDKHICSSALRVTLPAEIAALNDYRAFQKLMLGDTKVKVEGNDIVAPITFSSYRSEQNGQLIVYSEGENVAAKYIKGAHEAGAFDADLGTLPDLHAGLTLYTTAGKNLLLEPADNGVLKFHVNHQSHMCRSWTQYITEQRGDTLVYSNPQAGCSLFFSRLGQIMLVEHEGCELMAKACYPDGVYQKQ